jgi:hypothetical protein
VPSGAGAAAPAAAADVQDTFSLHEHVVEGSGVSNKPDLKIVYIRYNFNISLRHIQNLQWINLNELNPCPNRRHATMSLGDWQVVVVRLNVADSETPSQRRWRSVTAVVTSSLVLFDAQLLSDAGPALVRTDVRQTARR